MVPSVIPLQSPNTLSSASICTQSIGRSRRSEPSRHCGRDEPCAAAARRTRTEKTGTPVSQMGGPWNERRATEVPIRTAPLIIMLSGEYSCRGAHRRCQGPIAPVPLLGSPHPMPAFINWLLRLLPHQPDLHAARPGRLAADEAPVHPRRLPGPDDPGPAVRAPVVGVGHRRVAAGTGRGRGEHVRDRELSPGGPHLPAHARVHGRGNRPGGQSRRPGTSCSRPR